MNKAKKSGENCLSRIRSDLQTKLDQQWRVMLSMWVAQIVDQHNAEPGDHSTDELNRAVFIWHELLDGHWKLIYQFEENGCLFSLLQKMETGDNKGLSEREKQVVEYIVRGCSNKYIALDLALSESSVATMLNRAMKKLRVESRIDLIKTIPPLAFDVKERAKAG
ncbi:MAG TPA: LuxR C-terminal-related transcriptional regulator [bacterium]|nr:LuxR C-terminal-related transcriptional regulator [bacterium]